MLKVFTRDILYIIVLLSDYQQAVRCKRATLAAERRGPREAAEQMVRRKPHLGAEPGREEKTKVRNEKNS